MNGMETKNIATGTAITTLQSDDMFTIVRPAGTLQSITPNVLFTALFGLRGLESLRIIKANGSGASLLNRVGVGIVFAYSSEDSSKYLIYGFIRKESVAPTRFTIVGNLSLGAVNSLGTSVVTGADTQIALYLG